jgi:cell division protein FtsL
LRAAKETGAIVMQSETFHRPSLRATVNSLRQNIGIKSEPKSLESNHSVNHHPLRCGVVKRETDMATSPRRRATVAPRKQSFLDSINSNFMLVSTLVTLLVSMGMIYQQFTEVRKNQEVQSVEQKSVNARLTEISNKQIGGLQDIAALKTNVQGIGEKVQAIDGRVLVIERTFIEPAKKMR